MHNCILDCFALLAEQTSSSRTWYRHHNGGGNQIGSSSLSWRTVSGSSTPVMKITWDTKIQLDTTRPGRTHRTVATGNQLMPLCRRENGRHLQQTASRQHARSVEIHVKDINVGCVLREVVSLSVVACVPNNTSGGSHMYIRSILMVLAKARPL